MDGGGKQDISCPETTGQGLGHLQEEGVRRVWSYTLW